MQDIFKLIDDIYEEIVDIRRDFHENPELSQQEFRTAKKIGEYLDRWSIPYETNTSNCGIVAAVTGKGRVSDNQKFKAVGIRADMDALPITEKTGLPYASKNSGVMHSCGHDMHTAILLGAAKLLKSMESDLSGTVKFFFQPAEETVGGAYPLIEAGCLKNPEVSAVIALHVAPTIASGTVEFRRGAMNASSCEFEITIKGRSCHGAHPDLGVDSILAASHIVVALQSIVSRNLDPTDAGLVTVGQFNSGSQNNIIPPDAKLSGIIRALSNETRELLKERTLEIAQNTARAYGADVVCSFEDSYPALINDDELSDILEQVAARHLSSDCVAYMPNASLGADDFAYFTQAVKGVYFNIGTMRLEDSQKPTLHSEYYNPDETAMKIGILMEVMGTLEILKQTK